MAATTENTYTGDGSTTRFAITFEYLQESDVKATVNAETAAFTFANATQIEFNATPANSSKIRIFRETNTDEPNTTFFSGSSIRAQDLNDNNSQVLFRTQELSARAFDKTGDTVTGDLKLKAASIVFEGVTAPEDANQTILSTIEPTNNDNTINLPNASGTLPVLAAASTTQITSTPEELNKVDGYTGTPDNLNTVAGVTPGTAAASKAVVLDGDRDVSNIRNLSATKVTITTAPTDASDVATKDYVDSISSAGAIPAGAKGPDVTAISSTKWRVNSISTPQTVDSIDFATDYGSNFNHAMMGDVTVNDGHTITIGNGSVLTILG